MNISRLTTLAGLLDTVEPCHFNLGTWKCGNGACAIGHAAQYKPFIAEGFKIESTNLGRFVPVFVPQSGIRLWGWDAVEMFFDIDPAIAFSLFTAERYPRHRRTTPDEVALRIREVITRHDT